MESDQIDVAEIDFFERIQSLISAKAVRITHHISSICGVDAAYSSNGNRVVAAATLFVSWQSNTPREVDTSAGPPFCEMHDERFVCE